MKQPYTYSMPETFLKDKSVPARWRVLAVINGFILNGGCFYGSNEWLMEQLGCSEQTVSNAFSELEELGEIRTERTKRTRKVYKTSRDPNQLGSETQVDSTRDPSSFGTNSVSNSEKNTSEAEAPPVEEVVISFSEEEGRVRKPAKYPKAREVFTWFPEPEPSWKINTTECKHAELLYLRGESAVRGILAFLEKNQDIEDCPQVLSPYDLETKWKRVLAFAKRNGL